jgi:hypothetical protein
VEDGGWVVLALMEVVRPIHESILRSAESKRDRSNQSAMHSLPSVVVELCLLAVAPESADCSVTSKQLTWECGGLCDDHIPCVAYNASTECSSCVSDGECLPVPVPPRGL